MGSKQFLGAVENRLTLISASEEVISVYTLENLLPENPEWSLARRIKNVLLEGSTKWNVAAFDGKCLVVVVEIMKDGVVFHGYDMTANRWRVVGLSPKSFYPDQHLYHFTPSWSSVIGVVANPTELMNEEMAKLWSVYDPATDPKWIDMYWNLLDRHKIVTALSSFF